MRAQILAASGLAAPFCDSWRWLPLAAAIGAAPFAISYALKVGGHQVVSAVLLTFMCLNCARRDTWRKGVTIIAVAFAAHSLIVIAVSRADPQGASAFLPGAAAYWDKQMVWITTGQDAEYDWKYWLPMHVQLLVAVVFYSFTSLGALAFFEGFVEVDFMNHYTAQLMSRSSHSLQTLVAGWHAWSLLRGIGYAFIVFEVLSLSLQTMAGTTLSPWHVRRLRWGLGLLFIVVDGLVKFALLDTVRRTLLSNLL